MVGTVQGDDYSLLMRRIGYSVGLEKLRERVSQLIDAYVDARKLDTGVFIDVAQNKWEVDTGFQDRSKKRAEHMADVYAALGLFQLTQIQVQPLPGLEMASILVAMSSDFRRTEVAKNALLLHLITEADSDIFWNLALAAYDPQASADLLKQLVVYKRHVLAPLFPQKDLRQAVFNSIDFKTLANAKSKADAKPFFEQKVYAYAAPVEQEIEISDDLVDKAIKSRRKWAESLGLHNDGLLLPAGSRTLKALIDLGLRTSANGPIVLWPYEYGLRAFRILPEKAKISVPTRWEVLSSQVAAYLNVPIAEPDGELHRDSVVEICQRIFEKYKETDSQRFKLKAQVPLYILEPVFAIHCALEVGAILPLPQVIDLERRDPRRRMQLTPIRGADGGLIV